MPSQVDYACSANEPLHIQRAQRGELATQPRSVWANISFHGSDVCPVMHADMTLVCHPDRPGISAAVTRAGARVTRR